MMNVKRILRHLVANRAQVTRAFPKASIARIEQAIQNSEQQHAGQIRFAVEYALPAASLYQELAPRERAIDVFSQLRMWDTTHRNGVLIYVLLADRSVEIVADRGLHARTTGAVWEKICHDMEAAFQNGQYEAGVVSGIEAVTQLLMKHFPANLAAVNELPDSVIIL
ncbi:putative membrane protein [Oxalobacteraceae bacterium GrIS 2.11]